MILSLMEFTSTRCIKRKYYISAFLFERLAHDSRPIREGVTNPPRKAVAQLNFTLRVNGRVGLCANRSKRNVKNTGMG